MLLAHVLGKPRAWVLAHSEAELSPEQRRALEQAVFRLEQGEPLPYVLGSWEFFGLDFIVTSHTLIPRPETELLVERALAWLRAHPNRRLACDVGVGSGCIAVSLAVHLPDLHVLATDLSLAALQTARENVRRHGVEARVSCLLADLLPPSQARFDLICANLPYIPTAKLRSLQVYGREPTLALDGGPDGLTYIRRLLQSAPPRLQPGGMLLLEFEASQGPVVQSLARSTFPGAAVRTLPDLAGRERVLEVQLF